MCTKAGREAATAETIFNKMDAVLTKLGVPWKNRISLSVDNTSVNMGIRNSLCSRVLIKHPMSVDVHAILYITPHPKLQQPFHRSLDSMRRA